MNYRKNIEIWSIVIEIYKNVERQRERERLRGRESDRETRKG